MKYIRFSKYYFERSSKYVCEKHKYLIPTIEFYSNSIGTLYGWQFKFVWWKWWVKVYISFHVFERNEVKKHFYCQREIEFESKCNTQCDHCKEYYKPISKK